jgi:ribonucleoside-diphosphate reductase alpha chain
MKVKTRNGGVENMDFNKIKEKLDYLVSINNLTHVEPDLVAKETVAHIYDGISTSELDEHSANIAASFATIHPEYLKLAGSIVISSLHKETNCSCYNTWVQLANLKDKNGNPFSLISPKFLELIERYKTEIDSIIVHNRDYELFDFFGIKTLQRAYLLKDGEKVLERPQYMFLRVAFTVNIGSDFDFRKVVNTYNILSKGYYTHATPTLFNSGTCNQQLASCFLLKMKGDSIDGIFDTLKDCAQISKHAGGIGISIHEVRGTGSIIRGTNGVSNGLRPMLQVFNQTARYVDQGGGKRKGSISIYLEPWHSDIYDFLDLKTNTGDDSLKARDLFLALWVPDLFMERVEKKQLWSLMSPDECPGLNKVYGEEFNKLYKQYESEGKFRKQVNAVDLFRRIMEVQIETGVPYLCLKDSTNMKSNQKNIGVIESMNLCSEIAEYSSADEYGTCNLCSINLTKFVEGNYFDFEGLRKIAYLATENLDRVIDVNFYPCPETERSNSRHRPIGLGVQGLADVFFLLKLPFDSVEAQILNNKIFETIYYGAVEASADRAQKLGSYSTFEGSPFSQGQLQFDLWGIKPDDTVGALSTDELKGRFKLANLPSWDWNTLKLKVVKGMRNSLLTAVMPTASTSQILGNYECIEPQHSNIYVRKTMAGRFIVINKYLITELSKLGLWNENMKDQIIYYDGSVQQIETIPKEIKEIYKTVWEIKQKVIVDLAADRGKFVDQSQSMNIFMAEPDFSRLYSCHMYSFKKGLKTLQYYLRSRPATGGIKFNLGTFKPPSKEEKEEETECTMCSA